MRPIHATATLLFATCLALAGTVADARSIEDGKWIRMESPNFTIYSTVNERDTRKLIRHLESVRSLLPAVENEDLASDIPTRIFAVSTGNELEALGVDPDEYSGVFKAGLRSNFILMLDTYGYDGTSLITHEYVHYLLGNVVRFSFPRWYEEGYASYVGNSKLTRKHFSYGRAATGRLYFLAETNWLDMEKVIDSSRLLDYDEPKARSKFYAQSWLLVHYLYSQPGGAVSVAQGLQRYMIARRSGASETDAFEAGFGLPVDGLEQQLKRYMNKGKFRFMRFEIAPEIRTLEPEVIELEKPVSAVELAELLMALGETGSGREDSPVADPRDLFAVALDSEATRARAEMGLSQLAELDGNSTIAEEKAEIAARLAPDDLFVQLDATSLWLERASENWSASKDLAARAEPYLRRALSIDAGDAEVIYLTGLYLLLTGETESGFRHLETAAYKAPSVTGLRWNLIRNLALHGLRDKALHYARDLLATQHVSASFQREVRELIAELETQTEQ